MVDAEGARVRLLCAGKVGPGKAAVVGRRLSQRVRGGPPSSGKPSPLGGEGRGLEDAVDAKGSRRGCYVPAVDMPAMGGPRRRSGGARAAEGVRGPIPSSEHRPLERVERAEASEKGLVRRAPGRMRLVCASDDGCDGTRWGRRGGLVEPEGWEGGY